MPKIVAERYFDGARPKIARLGITEIMAQLREILAGWDLRVAERIGANSGAALRHLIDERFRLANRHIRKPEERWAQNKIVGIDWTRYIHRKGSRICIGVEIQVAARNGGVAVDLLHINKSLCDGLMDVGVLVVPSFELWRYLPSRCPSVSEAERMLDMFNVDTIPLVFFGLEHDGRGRALRVRDREAHDD